MSEPVFVDASAWVAITNRKDRNRGEAVRIFQRLLRTSTAMVTTNWTAYEALTIVKSRLGFSQAERLWERITSRSVVELVAVDEPIERDALKLSGVTKTRLGGWWTARVWWSWMPWAAGKLSPLTCISLRLAVSSVLRSLTVEHAVYFRISRSSSTSPQLSAATAGTIGSGWYAVSAVLAFQSKKSTTTWGGA
jgi:hypothetical protein